MPFLSAYLAHLTACFGGLVLIPGLWVRPVAGALAYTSSWPLALRGQPFGEPFQALQTSAVALFFLLNGAGAWSVDAWRRR